MTKGQLQTRITELQKLLEQIQANGNATMGALSECNYWLTKLEASETLPNEQEVSK